MTISTLELQSEAEGGWRLGLGGEWVPSDRASAQFPTDRALSDCGAIPPQPPARGPSPFRTQQHQQTSIQHDRGPGCGLARGSPHDAVSDRQPQGPLPDRGTDCQMLEGLLSPKLRPVGCPCQAGPLRGVGEGPKSHAQVPAPGELVRLEAG